GDLGLCQDDFCKAEPASCNRFGTTGNSRMALMRKLPVMQRSIWGRNSPLNAARSALRRADPSTATVAEVARNHQFREFARFAVTYCATFGASPSATLQRDPQT